MCARAGAAGGWEVVARPCVCVWSVNALAGEKDERKKEEGRDERDVVVGVEKNLVASLSLVSLPVCTALRCAARG